VQDFVILSIDIKLSKRVLNRARWSDYTLFCRKLAEDAGVTIRELDRALWQYSKENQ